MSMDLREELEVAASAAAPRTDLVARSREVGRRRLARRRGTAAGVGVVAAVVVAAASVQLASWTPSPDPSASLGSGPTSSQAAETSQPQAPDVLITGTASDWLDAVAASPQLGAGVEPLGVTTNGPDELAEAIMARAVFRYTNDGRATGLIVTAWARGAESTSGSSGWASLLDSCNQPGYTCDPLRQTTVGPVLVRRNADGGSIEALCLRRSGLVMAAKSLNGDTNADAPLPGSGQAGMADDVNRLIDIAARVPEPVLADAAATAGPTAN